MLFLLLHIKWTTLAFVNDWQTLKISAKVKFEVHKMQNVAAFKVGELIIILADVYAGT